MDITFNDNKLRKYANDDKKARQKLGDWRAKLYKQRLDDLKDVENLKKQDTCQATITSL